MPTTNKIRLLVALLGMLALAPRAAMAGDRDDNPRLAQESIPVGRPKSPRSAIPPIAKPLRLRRLTKAAGRID